MSYDQRLADVERERDTLRAEAEQYKQDFRDQEKRIQAAHRDLSEVTADRNIKRQLIEKLRAQLAAAQHGQNMLAAILKEAGAPDFQNAVEAQRWAERVAAAQEDKERLAKALQLNADYWENAKASDSEGESLVESMRKLCRAAIDKAREGKV